MVSKIVFTAIVALLATQRLLELQRSRANEVQLLGRGGTEHAPEQMVWMQLLHGAWFVSMLAEVWLFDVRPVTALSAVAFALFLVGQGLRQAAMHALSERWTVRIITLPAIPAVERGIYRYLRHPNYLGVILEIAAVPLMHAAWRTAALFTMANAVLLAFRIRAEETALARDNQYTERFSEKPRLLPNMTARRRPRLTS